MEESEVSTAESLNSDNTLIETQIDAQIEAIETAWSSLRHHWTQILIRPQLADELEKLWQALKADGGGWELLKTAESSPMPAQTYDADSNDRAGLTDLTNEIDTGDSSFRSLETTAHDPYMNASEAWQGEDSNLLQSILANQMDDEFQASAKEETSGDIADEIIEQARLDVERGNTITREVVPAELRSDFTGATPVEEQTEEVYDPAAEYERMLAEAAAAQAAQKDAVQDETLEEPAQKAWMAPYEIDAEIESETVLQSETRMLETDDSVPAADATPAIVYDQDTASMTAVDDDDPNDMPTMIIDTGETTGTEPLFTAASQNTPVSEDLDWSAANEAATVQPVNHPIERDWEAPEGGSETIDGDPIDNTSHLIQVESNNGILGPVLLVTLPLLLLIAALWFFMSGNGKKPALQATPAESLYPSTPNTGKSLREQSILAELDKQEKPPLRADADTMETGDTSPSSGDSNSVQPLPKETAPPSTDSSMGHSSDSSTQQTPAPASVNIDTDLEERLTRLEEEVEALKDRFATLALRKPRPSVKTVDLESDMVEAITVDELATLFDNPMDVFESSTTNIKKLNRRVYVLEKAYGQWLKNNGMLPRQPRKNGKKRQHQKSRPHASKKIKSSSLNQAHFNWHVNFMSIFKKKAMANDMLKTLKNKGVNARVVEVQLRGKTWYRLRTPAFASYQKAKDYTDKIEGAMGDIKHWISKTRK